MLAIEGKMEKEEDEECENLTKRRKVDSLSQDKEDGPSTSYGKGKYL